MALIVTEVKVIWQSLNFSWKSEMKGIVKSTGIILKEDRECLIKDIGSARSMDAAVPVLRLSPLTPASFSSQPFIYD